MKVKELINVLEKVRNKEIEVIIKVLEEFDFGVVEKVIKNRANLRLKHSSQ